MLGGVLVDSGQLTRRELSRALAERHGLEHLDLEAFEVDAQAAKLIEPAIARDLEAVPVAYVDDRTLLVAVADPTDWVPAEEIERTTGLGVHPAVAAPEDILGVIERLPQRTEGPRFARRP